MKLDESAMDLVSMQWIASSALAVASLTVAIVALKFSYRNNFGWKPIILVIGQGAGRDPSDQSRSINLKFQVWNRRKYPIVLRVASIKFPGVPLGAMDAWTNFDNEVIWHNDPQTIKPSENYELVSKIEIPGKMMSIGAPYIISAQIYDPMGNHYVMIRHRGAFMEWNSRWQKLIHRAKRRLLPS